MDSRLAGSGQQSHHIGIVDITADQFPEVHKGVIVTNVSEWHRQWEPRLPEEGALKPYGKQLPGLRHLLATINSRLEL